MAFQYVQKEKNSIVATRIPERVQFSSYRSEYSKVSDLLTIPSYYKRQVELRELLAPASIDLIKELLQEFDSKEYDHSMSSMKSEVLKRLTMLDPIQASKEVIALPWHKRTPYIAAVFSEWSSTDLSAAIRHVETLSMFDQGIAIKAILNSASHLTDSQIFKLARSFDQEILAENFIQERIMAISSEDPESAWFALLSDDRSDYDQTRNLATIAKAWIEVEGMGVLDRLTQSIRHYNTRRAFLNHLAEMLAHSNPKIAFDHVKHWLDDPNGSSIRTVVTVWARKEPTNAMAAIGTLDRSELKKQLQQSVISVWAKNSPWDLLENTNNLPNDLREVALERAISVIAKQSPWEATELITHLSDSAAKTRTQQAIVSSWIRNDIDEALNWVLERVENQHQKRYLLTFIWPALAKQRPDYAMQIALKNPLNNSKSELGLEVDVIRSIAQTDLDLAISFLPKVRNGITKVAAYSIVGVSLAQAGKSLDAIELGLQLDDSLHLDYFNSLVSDWAYKDPLGLFEALDQIPIQQARSTASMRLEMSNRFHKVFSVEQLEQIKGYRSKHHVRQLESIRQ